MKALQFLGDSQYAVSDLPTPSIEDDEVLLAARSVGICHSDIDLLRGRYIIPFNFPVIPGHEWAAEVVATGRKVTRFAAGDRVVGECVIGQEHFGFSISGAAAELFVAKEGWLHALPDDLTWTQGALVEPFSCGYYATLRADNLDASDTAVVLGAGPIGLGVVAAAASRGVRVIVAEPDPSRAALAQALGAEITLDPTDPDIGHRLDEVTSGRRADVVFEASGKPAAMASALDLAGFRARLVYIGIDVGGSAPAALGQIQSKELRRVRRGGSVLPLRLRRHDMCSGLRVRVLRLKSTTSGTSTTSPRTSQSRRARSTGGGRKTTDRQRSRSASTSGGGPRQSPTGQRSRSHRRMIADQVMAGAHAHFRPTMTRRVLREPLLLAGRPQSLH